MRLPARNGTFIKRAASFWKIASSIHKCWNKELNDQQIPCDIKILGWWLSWLPHGEVASLALVGYLSCDGLKIKMPYGVDVLHWPASHPIFSYWVVKTESCYIVRSAETGLGRWMLVVAVISVDAYPFLPFSDLTYHLEDTGVSAFWLHCVKSTVKRPNLEVVNKRLLHWQIPG